MNARGSNLSGIKRIVLSTALVLLLASCEAYSETAVVEGTIWNATVNEPATAEEVELLRLEGGMQRVASLRDAKGAFRFELTELPTAPHLLRVTYLGVHYNTPVSFAGVPVVRVQTAVFDTTDSLQSVRVENPHLFLRVQEGVLRVEWAMTLVNDPASKRTVANPQGTFQFTLPEDASRILYVTTQSGMMPVQQSPKKIDGGTYALASALKPGETELRIGYELPYGEKRYHLDTLVSLALEALWVIVSPADLKLSAPGLKELERSAEQDFCVYELRGLAAGTRLEIDIQGGTPKKESATEVTKVARWPLATTWAVILALWGLTALAVAASERVALSARQPEATGG